MKPSLEDLFHAALALETEAERSAYLDEACGADLVTKRRVVALLAAHAEADSFLEAPLVSPPTGGVVPATELGAQPGTRIGPYKLLQEIGEGGMGVVYMAEQEEPVRRKVALKIIKLGMDTKQVIARFEAERQALALMEHTNIARVLDAGATEAGRPYFVMELVRGVPIDEYCDKHQLPTEARLRLFIDTCRAVQHAHQKGIIHRDIKPGNVLVTSHDGTPVVKIIDFGVAKATSQKLTEKTLFTEFRQFIGTPEYMSPEQAEMSGLDVDTRTDIYALGVLFYQLLVGSTPFDAKTLRSGGYGEMTRMIREDEPPTPSTRLATVGGPLDTLAKSRGSNGAALVKQLRGDLDWIVMKAIAKDRTRRYDSASELADDVVRHLGNEPVLASPPSALYRGKKLILRNQRLVAASALAMAGLLLGLVLALSGYFAAKAEAERSNKIRAALTEMLAVVGSPDGLDLEVRALLVTAREAFGDNDAMVAATLAAMAGQLRNSNDLEASERLYSEALAIYSAKFGAEHALTGRTLGSLGVVQSLNGKLEVARASLTKALRIEAMRSGGPTLASSTPRLELARLHGNEGSYEAADALFVEALEILGASKTPRPYQVVMLLEERLVTAVADPDHGDLAPTYDELIAAADAAFPEGNLVRANARFGKGMYLMSAGARDEAQVALQEAVVALESVESHEPVYLMSALDALYQLQRQHTSPADVRLADDTLMRFLEVAPRHWKPGSVLYGKNVSAATGLFFDHGRLDYALRTGESYMHFAGTFGDEDDDDIAAERLSDLILTVAESEDSTPTDFAGALRILDEYPEDDGRELRREILEALVHYRLGELEDLDETLDQLGARDGAERNSALLARARDLTPSGL
jgi:serine/threonine protein kinase